MVCRFQSNFYTRQTGTDILPARIKLLASVELPLLKLELVKGEKRIKAYANDIIRAQEVRYERVLVFRNVDNAPAIVYMHIAGPFHVVSIRTAQTDTTENATAAVVQPGECVEVISTNSVTNSLQYFLTGCSGMHYGCGRSFTIFRYVIQ